MKKPHAFLTAMLLLLCPALFAGTFDLGVTVGSRNHFFERTYDNAQLSLQYGLTMGITDVYEIDLTASSECIPDFFGTTQMQLLLQRSLLGARNSGTKVAGMGCNMLLGFGIGFSDFNETNKFTFTHLLISFTPLMGGSPSLRKRERAFACTLGINIYTQQVSLYFDLMADDFYIVGTYKDHLDEI